MPPFTGRGGGVRLEIVKFNKPPAFAAMLIGSNFNISSLIIIQKVREQSAGAEDTGGFESSRINPRRRFSAQTNECQGLRKSDRRHKKEAPRFRFMPPVRPLTFIRLRRDGG